MRRPKNGGPGKDAPKAAEAAAQKRKKNIFSSKKSRYITVRSNILSKGHFSHP